MVYYALTTYHVLCCVLHKMAVHPQEPATLLLSDIHRNSVAFARRYEQSGIFDRVVVLPELSVLDHQRYLERKHLPVKLGKLYLQPLLFIVYAVKGHRKMYDIDLMLPGERSRDITGTVAYDAKFWIHSQSLLMQ